MEYMDIAYIIAEDGVGHRVKWTVGETISYSKSAFWYKFIIIICTFISIAYISSRRVKKKISISLQ